MIPLVKEKDNVANWQGKNPRERLNISMYQHDIDLHKDRGFT